MNITVTISPRIPEPFRGTVTILAWLAACEAAPPWAGQPGTPALWTRLARVAFDGGWPREGIVEETQYAADIVRAAVQLATVAGAPASPEIGAGCLDYKTCSGTAIFADCVGLTVQITGEPASVLRRATAAQTAADALLTQFGEPEPAF